MVVFVANIQKKIRKKKISDTSVEVSYKDTESTFSRDQRALVIALPVVRTLFHVVTSARLHVAKKIYVPSRPFRDYVHLHITRWLSPVSVWTVAKKRGNRGSSRFSSRSSIPQLSIAREKRDRRSVTRGNIDDGQANPF